MDKTRPSKPISTWLLGFAFIVAGAAGALFSIDSLSGVGTAYGFPNLAKGFFSKLVDLLSALMSLSYLAVGIAILLSSRRAVTLVVWAILFTFAYIATGILYPFAEFLRSDIAANGLEAGHLVMIAVPMASLAIGVFVTRRLLEHLRSVLD